MWRVYRKQWITMYTSTGTGQEGRNEVEQHFHDRFGGRVDEAEDVCIDAAENTVDRTRLRVRLPVLAGEYLEEKDAWWRAGDFEGLPHQVVQSGDEAERELLAYGRRRLHGEDQGGAGDRAGESDG